jgi:hypothetical protein
MEARSPWYEDIAEAITSFQQTLAKKEQKRYKLDLVSRVARRVDEFCLECGQCQVFQQEITAYAQDLGNLVQMPDKTRLQRHLKKINHMVKHMQSEHKLIAQGHYLGIWMAIGTGIGVAIGAGMGNVGAGIPIGTGIGLAIGAGLDAKAKKEGRVI